MILASRSTKIIWIIQKCLSNVWVLLMNNKILRLLTSCSQVENTLNSRLWFRMKLIYKWWGERGLTQEPLGLFLFLRTFLCFRSPLLQLLFSSRLGCLLIIEGGGLMLVSSRVDRKLHWHQSCKAQIRSSDQWTKLDLFWMLLLLIIKPSWDSCCRIRMVL